MGRSSPSGCAGVAPSALPWCQTQLSRPQTRGWNPRSDGPLTLVAAIFHATVVAHDAHAMELPDMASQTIRVDDLGIPPTPFDLTQPQKATLYASGQAAARDFLTTWHVDAYKTRFPSGVPDVRRQPGLAGSSTDEVADRRRVPGR